LADRYVNDKPYQLGIHRRVGQILVRLAAKGDITDLVPRKPLDQIMVNLILASQSERVWGFNTAWRAARDASKPPPDPN
jgi:hypothetical protein